MRRALVGLVVVASLIGLIGGLAGAQGKKQPDGTIELSEG
jgi:hypothetical protein